MSPKDLKTRFDSRFCRMNCQMTVSRLTDARASIWHSAQRRSRELSLWPEAMDIPHELRDEFTQEISLIERMIRTNYEFRRLAERYDEVNRNIYRIESGEEPTTDEVLARLKKWRLKFKDEIAAILTKLEHRM